MDIQSVPAPVITAPKRPWILSILVLVLLASTSYLAFENYQLKKIIGSLSTSPFPTSSPTTDPTADWKIYSYPSLGFSIKLPLDWLVKPLPSPDLKIIEENGAIEGPSLLIGPTEMIQNLDPEKDSPAIGNLRGVIKGYFGYGGMLNNTVPEVTITIDGKTAKKKISQEKSAFFEEVALPVDGKTLLVLIIQDSSMETLLDQILSTFKFTPQADIGTYTNSTYRFGFDYPTSWHLTEGYPSRILLYANPADKDPGDLFNVELTVDSASNDRNMNPSDPIGTKKTIAEGVVKEKVQNITLGRRTASKSNVTVSPQSGTDAVPHAAIETIIDSMFLTIRFIPRDIKNIQQGFDQILATFKFTNQ